MYSDKKLHHIYKYEVIKDTCESLKYLYSWLKQINTALQGLWRLKDLIELWELNIVGLISITTKLSDYEVAEVSWSIVVAYCHSLLT